LRVVGFTDQHHFLIGIISGSPDLTSESSAKIKRELQTLLHPEMLGRAFQVLALAKNIDPAVRKLVGFKFAGKPDAALALINPSR
jgi:SAM-dependent MidA family methyltransferase